MSVRNLDLLFEPTSVAVVGASLRPGSLGGQAWHNLRSSSFGGVLYPINPKYHALDGVVVHARVAHLPATAQLAVICTPARTVAKLVAELGAHGTRAVIVLTPDMTADQRQAMLAAAGRCGLRILGPGSVGLWHPALGLSASAAAVGGSAGEVALVSQSGAVVAAMLDWSKARNIGFSKCVSLGTQLDVDVSDVLDFLGSDPTTKAILLCVERVGDARKFMSAARAAARNKPLIVVKSGRFAQGQGHSHAMASERIPADAVFDAAIGRAGMLRVNSLQDLFLAAEMLTRFRQSNCESLVILSNGRGPGVMAVDAAVAMGLPLVELDAHAQRLVEGLWPALGEQRNPVRVMGDASAAASAQTLQALWTQPGTAVLLVHAPTASVPSADVAEALLALPGTQSKRLLACWLGAAEPAPARQSFRQAGVPVFDTPEQAVSAFAMLRTFRHNQKELMQTPPARTANLAVDAARMRALVATVLAGDREWLTETEAQTLLVAAGVLVATAPERRQCAHGPRLVVDIDPLFGPCIAFGQGDWAPLAVADMAVALPPLNVPLALALIQRTQAGRGLLAGGVEADQAQSALVQLMLAVSQLLVDVPELAALDIHALHFGAEGVSALGARVRLSASRPGGAPRFAIQPYPQHLEESTQWRGQPLVLRPIRPEDEGQHLDFLRQMSPEDIRMRVFYSRRTIEHTELARLTQIDYAREMAFIATRPLATGGAETLGVVRATVDSDNDAAEFGLLIRSDLKGGGLGRMLMLKLIAHLRAQGTRRLIGTVLSMNAGMLGLAQKLGFEESTVPNDPDEHDIRHVSLPLQADPRSRL